MFSGCSFTVLVLVSTQSESSLLPFLLYLISQLAILFPPLLSDLRCDPCCSFACSYIKHLPKPWTLSHRLLWQRSILKHKRFVSSGTMSEILVFNNTRIAYNGTIVAKP